MATIVVVFKILFLVLIAHNSFVVTLPEQVVLIKKSEDINSSGNEALKERFERANLTGHELASAKIEEGEKWWPFSDLRIKRHNKGNNEEQGSTSSNNDDGEDEDSSTLSSNKDATTATTTTTVGIDLQSQTKKSLPEEESAVIVEEVSTNREELINKEDEDSKPSVDKRLGDTAATATTTLPTTNKWLEVSSNSDAKFKSSNIDGNDDAELLDEREKMREIEREPSISVSISSTSAPFTTSSTTPSITTTTTASAATTTTKSTRASTKSTTTTNADGLEDRRDQVNYAELCYLSNGGSSLTLTVNEATQVGAIIGTVEVNGDPALEGGNVDLFVATSDGSAQAQAQALSQQQPRNSTTAEAASSSSSSTSSLDISNLYGKQQTLHRQFGRELRTKRETVVGEFGSRRAGGGREILRESRNMIASSAPPPSQLQISPPTATLGLINDYQLSNQAVGASFYSLVASTANPSYSSASNSASTQSIPVVRLDLGTRNLILTRPLDKESLEGEQGFVVNVRCNPRAVISNSIDSTPSSGGNSNSRSKQSSISSLDSTTIPVRIIVTDANDHAPEFVGPQPYIVNISETSPIGSVVSRDILAIDRDSAGPFSTLHYRVLDDGSAHSTLLQFANPLDPTLMVAGQLDYETLSSFVVTIVAQDQGEPEPLFSKAQVQVNVIDFDDQNPKFMDEKYTLVMDDTQQNLVGQNLQILPRNLYAEDGDKGINAPILYSFDQIGAFQQNNRYPTTDADLTSVTTASTQTGNSLIDEPSVNIEHYLHLNPTSGEIRLIRQWPNRWVGSPMTLVVRATQADNKDRYTLTTLTIMRHSSTISRTFDLVTPKSSKNGENESGDIETATSGHSEINIKQFETNFGLKFVPDKLSVDVPENVAINEKIAKVRARYQANNPTINTNEQDSAALSEMVDLISESSSPSSAKQTNRTVVVRKPRDQQQQQQQQQQKRPINYQILDDQTDQFGINGLGEIFVKRPLDYEQRQSYKFRVLATYTKYSDICHVQVNVLNVNDNKPKFTQPLYTFHLTESRLKNNVIGVVLAHDADLNDTLRYSISGEHEHLFDISQSSGQLSLKSNIKQLNITSCHLIVIATDSLKPSPNGFHSHQARVNLHVAPQLVGRSINFGGTSNAENQQDNQQDTKVLSSRISNEHQHNNQQQDWSSNGPSSLSARFAGGAQVSRSLQTTSSSSGSKEVTPSNQRSSVATVMSSLQHMVRSVNFLEMPMSSALLLSALLAFLICLLFIVIISMSVHFYRRRMKQQRHRHRHLAAAAHLRHAHLASALHGPQATARFKSSTTTNNNNNSINTAAADSSNSLSITNSSPTNSTGADASPRYLSPHTSPSETFIIKGSGFVSNNGSGNGKRCQAQTLQTTVSNSGGGKQRSNRSSSRVNDVIGGSNNGSCKDVFVQRLSVGTPSSLNNFNCPSKSSSNHRTNSRLSVRSPVNNCSTIRGGAGEAFNRIKSVSSNLHQAADNSLISTISSHSKRSYQSNTTDDSSVMHCGHYSVNPEGLSSPLPVLSATATTTTASIHEGRVKIPARSKSREKSIEAAIKSLVREEEVSDSETETNKTNGLVGLKQKTQAPSEPEALIAEMKLHQQQQQHQQEVNEELSVLTNSKPGIKSYRKLPLSSLARQHNRVAPEESVTTIRRDSPNNGSAILSEATTNSSSATSSSNSNSTTHNKSVISRDEAADAGLMAMIRNPEKRILKGTENLISNFAQHDSIIGRKFNDNNYSNQNHQGGGQETNRDHSIVSLNRQTAQPNQNYSNNNNFKWPHDAIPSRVKKLTWDDELSVSNEDCFVAPELRNISTNSCPISPLSINHQYPIEGTTNNEDQYAEQHFLFSNPCSPALMSTDFNSSAYLAQQQQQQQQQQPHSIALQSIGNNLPELDCSSIMGQNNCFDYTIVQSSQFQVDTLNSTGCLNQDLNNNHLTNNQPSLSAQHHHQLLQQKQQTKRPLHNTNSYLYSNSIINTNNNFESKNCDQSQNYDQQQRNFVASASATASTTTTNQDLTSHLMTTAVL